MMNIRRFSSYKIHFIILVIHLFGCLIYTNGDIFEPLIRLPRLNPVRSTKVFNLKDFGAKGDGFNNDTQAFKDAWELVCSFPSRPVLEIPMGTYMVGPIDLGGPCLSKVTLRISGTITAPKDPDVWRGLNPRKWIYFHGLKYLTIKGGLFDGKGEEWWKRSCKINITNPCRHAPTAITFHRCKHLRVNNLMMVNSQQMHMAFTNCARVRASYLKVMAPVRSPNTDAIHISHSTFVDVKSTTIETGDDCVSIVGNSSRIRIRDISCKAGHGISIGSLGKYKSRSQVYDVFVNRAFLSNTENGVRIKTWQGGSGVAERIIFQNVLMENVSNPIIIDQYYCDSRMPCQNQTSAVKVRDISFVGIKGTSATMEAMRFACSDSSPCEGIFLKDIELSSYSGGITSASCWAANGSSSGKVFPPPCFSWNQSFIEQKVARNVDMDTL